MSGSRRVRFFYINIRILEFTPSYFVFYFAAFKFEELVPVVEESEEKTKKFLALSKVERSFRFDQVTLQESSSATDLMSTTKDPSFLSFVMKVFNSLLYRIQSHSLQCLLQTR